MSNCCQFNGTLLYDNFFFFLAPLLNFIVFNRLLSCTLSFHVDHFFFNPVFLYVYTYGKYLCSPFSVYFIVDIKGNGIVSCNQQLWSECAQEWTVQNFTELSHKTVGRSVGVPSLLHSPLYPFVKSILLVLYSLVCLIFRVSIFEEVCTSGWGDLRLIFWKGCCWMGWENGYV